MRKFLFFCLSILLVFLAGPCSGYANARSESKPEGLRAQELSRFSNSLSDIEAPIVAIRFFRIHGVGFPGGIALLLADEKTGWQIRVYTRMADQDFRLVWQSKELHEAFATSSYDRLRTYILRDEEIVVFDGCAAHSCPDVYAILMYVPSKGAAFWARRTHNKTVIYSPGLELPENSVYKDWLDRQIAEHIKPSQ